MKKNILVCLSLAVMVSGCKTAADKKDRLAKATRENKNGWIYLHVEGSPADIGYQHALPARQ